jgi:hypothetical protein
MRCYKPLPDSPERCAAMHDLSKHPWNMGGGGAADLKQRLDKSAPTTLRKVIDHIGYTGQTNADEVMTFADPRIPRRYDCEEELLADLIVGDVLRDWRIQSIEAAFLPYRDGQLVALNQYPGSLRRLCPFRETLLNRATFGKSTYRREGRPWYEWHLIRLGRLHSASLCFSNVATHNHFVLDQNGRLLNPHAPAVKLAAGADGRSQLEILGILNGSVACFWLRNTMHDKGNRGQGGGITDEAWERFFEFDGAKLLAYPLPAQLDASTASLLNRLAIDLARVTPAAVVWAGVPSAVRLAEAKHCYSNLRAQMVAAQERLDWEVYSLYGLVEDDLTTGSESEPPLQLGERAFEIVLARRMAAGEEKSSWFERRRSKPIVELPRAWADSYKRLVERRIQLIETDPIIGLIERPEYKRSWAAKPWDEQVKVALQAGCSTGWSRLATGRSRPRSPRPRGWPPKCEPTPT